METQSLISPPMDVLSSHSGASITAGMKGLKSREKLEQAARDFEAVFMAQMLKPMWEGIEIDPVFGGGTGEEVMRDMLLQEYGKAMISSDNYGLSTAVMNEMIKMQNQAEGRVSL